MQLIRFTTSKLAIFFAAIFLLTLTGCGEKEPVISQNNSSPSDILPPARKHEIVKRVATEANAVKYGTHSGKTAYVFFDPKCTHCGDLWRSAEAFKNDMSFVWIPVSILGEESTGIGATILGSPNPVESLAKNESSLHDHGKGMPVNEELVTAHKQSIVSNTTLLTTLVPEFPVSSVPFTVFVDNSGHIELFAGAVDQNALSSIFRLAPGVSK